MKKFDIDFSKISEKNTCTLCFEAFSELASMPNCNHFICKTCFKNDIEPKALESKALYFGCPSPGCISAFPSNMIFNIFPESSKTENNSIESQQNPNFEKPNIKKCPKCQIWIEKLDINRNIYCKICNLVFCSICGESENHSDWSCLKQSKKDMYYIVLALYLMFFPVSSLFSLTFWFYFEADNKDLYKNPEKIKNKCVNILIFVSMTIASVLIYFIMISMIPLGIAGYVLMNISDRIKKYNESLEILGQILFMVLFIPFSAIGAVIFALFYIFLPFIGIALLIFKLTIMCKH